MFLQNYLEIDPLVWEEEKDSSGCHGNQNSAWIKRKERNFVVDIERMLMLSFIPTDSLVTEENILTDAGQRVMTITHLEHKMFKVSLKERSQGDPL